MRNYTVYFEIYKRKMKVKILAKSKDEAVKELMSKMIVHKVDYDNKDIFNESMDGLDGFMNMIDNIKKP